MMRKDELQKELKRVGVPEDLYNLNRTGRKDERFCLEKDENGWHVYFIERGIKTTNERFDSEEKACQYIYEQLLD